MKKRLRVSIVIPVFNEQHQLAGCLEAIAAQTAPVHEVIVVDNNSGDETVAVAGRYPFVRVVREKQQGIVFARNTGFDATTGDIIGRIDADVRLPQHWVAHVQAFYRNQANLKCGWSGSGFFYNVRLARFVSWAYGMLAFRFNWFLLGHYTLWGSNMAITRAQWQAVRDQVHLRNDIHEDLDLAIHLRARGFGITYDTSIKTNAHLRRAHTNRDQLWDELQWWPRTLRIHGKWSWVICWFFGAFLLYGISYILVIAEWAARRLGRPPLPS